MGKSPGGEEPEAERKNGSGFAKREN